MDIFHLLQAATSATSFPGLVGAMSLFEKDHGAESFAIFLFPFLLKQFESFRVLFPNGVPQLSRATPLVDLTRTQCLVLVTMGFLCQIPKNNGDFPINNMLKMHTSGEKQQISKLRHIMEYFEIAREREGTDPLPPSHVYFVRLRFDASRNTCKKWASVDIRPKGVSIDEQRAGCLRVDFANSFIGGGAWSHGCVQEEITFSLCPEMGAAITFAPVMKDDEAIAIFGAEQFTEGVGYSRDFGYKGRHSHTEPLRESIVIAIDAISYNKRNGRRVFDQFQKDAVQRDIVKAIAGFGLRTYPDDAKSPVPDVVMTGNWGCGDFDGELELKFLQQWIACSVTEKKMSYCVYDAVSEHQLTVVCKPLLDNIALHLTPTLLRHFLTGAFRTTLATPSRCLPSAMEQSSHFALFVQKTRSWNWKDEDSAVTNIVLLTSGAFNPIHTGHVSLLNESRKFLNEHHSPHLHVCGCVISPSSDSYVKQKLHESAMSLDARCELAQVTADAMDATVVCDWGDGSGKATAECFQIMLRAITGRENIVCLEVYGSDFCIKYNRFEKMVCVHRGETGDAVKALVEAKAVAADFYYVPLSLPDDISSTAIRVMLTNGERGLLDRVLPGGVMDRLVALNERLFLEPFHGPSRIHWSLHPAGRRVRTTFDDMILLRASVVGSNSHDSNKIIIIDPDTDVKKSYLELERLGYNLTSYTSPGSYVNDA